MCVFNRLFSSSITLGLTWLAAFLALASAYVAEYGFSLYPCELCLWQRKPFMLVMLLAGAALFLRKPVQRRLLLILIGIAFLGNTLLALYHTGVEQKWWRGPASCSNGEIESFSSIDDLRAHILSTPLVRCDVPAWEFHGLTMASANIAYSFIFALFAFWSVYAATRPQN